MALGSAGTVWLGVFCVFELKINRAMKSSLQTSHSRGLICTSRNAFRTLALRCGTRTCFSDHPFLSQRPRVFGIG
jgi:hypothetical protein